MMGIHTIGYRKAKFEEIARERFLGSRVFPAVRDAYQRVFSPQKFMGRRQLFRFYSQFIRPGDLVFDVGANVGVYTEVFAALGAVVVAIEPNPRCARVLQLLARRHPVHVELCAAGDQNGRKTLQICETHLLSTLAPRAEDAARRSPEHRAAKWLAEIEVEVKTLDSLAQSYGVPRFVKIDAEGFDDRVISGMSFEPSAISFEYYKHLPEIASRCLQAPLFAGGYEFNYLTGLGNELASPSWMERSELTSRLELLASEGGNYGDVVARRMDADTRI
jgi:FkbM family methyltransferase